MPLKIILKHKMFSGIVEKLSRIEKITKKGELFIYIKTPKKWKVEKGESISINGVCSTVKNVYQKSFVVEYMPETLRKTTAGSFRKNTLVNMEKSLKVNDFLGGHIVQGHIDATGTVIGIAKEENSVVLKIQAPRKLMKFIANKGSVAVDGISLTVVDAGYNWFTVSLVSFTLENTNLGKIKRGGKVNLEVDIIAKYLGKLIENYLPCKEKIGEKKSIK